VSDRLSANDTILFIFPTVLSLSAYSLTGHVHPARVLQGRGRGADRVRLPCFVFSDKRGILPAFGVFTGHHTVSVQEG